MAGRPLKEFDTNTFVDLVGLGCDQKEICWFFRDETGKPANIDTLSRWCKRTFKMNFQEYSAQNKGIAMKIKLRKAGVKLVETNPSVHIFYCKNFLGMTDKQEITTANIDDQTRNEVNSLVEKFNKYKSKPESDEGNSD